MPERCHGVTRSGERCRRSGNHYCYQHAPRQATGGPPKGHMDHPESNLPTGGRTGRRHRTSDGNLEASLKALQNLDTTAILRAYQSQLASIDTTAILRRQLASIDTTAILRRQLASIDRTAILKAFQHQLASLDTTALLRRQLANIDTTAILNAYQASLAGFITSPLGQSAVAQATTALADTAEPAGEPPIVHVLDEAQLGAVSTAIADLQDLAAVDPVAGGEGLEWMVAATVYDPGSELPGSRPTAVQTAIMTMVIVSALSTVIASSPALAAAFGLMSIPVTLWPFIKALVTSMGKSSRDEER